jgi:hypothetical protein
MKKNIFGALVVVAIAVGAMINVNLNKVSNKGDLALANVEALAQDEGGGEGYECPQLITGVTVDYTRCPDIAMPVISKITYKLGCGSGTLVTLCKIGYSADIFNCQGYSNTTSNAIWFICGVN